MKKIIIALLFLVPFVTYARSIEISDIKDCGSQEVTMSGPAFGFDHAIIGDRGIEVTLDGKVLTGVMNGESFKTESWIKTVRVGSGNHLVKAVIYDGLSMTNIISEDEVKFEVESCKQSSKVSEPRQSSSGGYTLAKRCEMGKAPIQQCLNRIAVELEKVKALLAELVS